MNTVAKIDDFRANPGTMKVSGRREAEKQQV